MKTRSTIIIMLTLLLLIGTNGSAQPLNWYGKSKPYSWMFGVSWIAVDDDGRDFCQPFDAKQSWNTLAFPSRIMVDKYFKYGISAEFSGAYNRYTQGKLINDSTNYEGLFLSFDANCKYSFYNLIGIRWFDPYATLGIGLTQRTAFENTYTFTGNINFGANFFVFKGFGIQIQTAAKIGITGDFLGDSDYFQHSLGLVYKIQPKRGRSSFSNKHYKWTHKKMRYKSNRRTG